MDVGTKTVTANTPSDCGVFVFMIFNGIQNMDVFHLKEL
jgi:hypothetical protein